MNFLNDIKNYFTEDQIILKQLDEYASDKTPEQSAYPDCVILAKSEKDIQTLCQLVTKHKVPLTVRASGSGTTGGALALHGGVILSMEKLNQVKELDTVNKMITVEPGVITGDIHKMVEQHGLFYPPDPQSSDYCSIGGNIAENAGGPKALKYGVTSHYVIGLKGYYIDGTPFEYGGKQLKNVAGYNLIQLIVGSEGTLAIVTEITLKLISKPKYSQDMIILFNNYDDAVQSLAKLQSESLSPSIVEFLDGFCFEAVSRYLNIDVKYAKAPASLLIECDGYTKDSVKEMIKKIEMIANDHSAIEIIDLESEADREFAWNCRKQFSLALTSISHHKKSEDVVVPPSEIPQFLKQLKSIGSEYGLTILGYGHLGDGNIHVNILDLTHHENWKVAHKEAISKIMKAAVGCGGTISGEHGIGSTKKEYMSLLFSSNDLQIMKSIKKTVDPNNLLNPGKIF